MNNEEKPKQEKIILPKSLQREMMNFFVKYSNSKDTKNNGNRKHA